MILFKHRIWIVVAVLGITAFGAWTYAMPMFFGVPISHVRVAGELCEIRETSLREAISTHLASGFFGLNVAAVREDVRKLPWLKSVSVRRIWPGSLHIAVTEHRPEARWYEGGLIATDGTLFFPPVESYPMDLPILKGVPGTYAEMLDQYRKLRRVLEPIGQEIRRFTRTERLIWRIELDTGLNILLEDKDPINVVKQFARTATAILGERIENVSDVDLRYANGFAVRWRPTSSLEISETEGGNLEKVDLVSPPEVIEAFRVDLYGNKGSRGEEIR